MKHRRTLGFFAAALTALVCALPRAATADGCVRSIEFYPAPAGGEAGVVTDLSQPLVAGQKVQFKIRLLNCDAAQAATNSAYVSTNSWTCRWEGGPMAPGMEDMFLVNFPPKIGVRVSGRLEKADIVSWDRAEGEAGRYYTDLICRYTVKTGDYAMPLRLASADGTRAALAADPTDPTAVPEETPYWIDKMWGFFPKTPSDNVTTNRLRDVFYFGPAAGSVRPAALGQKLQEFESSPDGTAPARRDYDLGEANIQIRTVDFDTLVAEDGIWRSIHAESSSSDPAEPSLAVTGSGGASGPYDYYVWTEDANVAVVVDGTDYTFKDGVTRKVKTVKVLQGATSAGFTLKATGPKDATTKIYMADTPTNIYDRAGTLIKNFTERTISIGDRLKPSIKVVRVTPADERVTTSTNGLVSAASYKVVLTEAWTGADPLQILVTPTVVTGALPDPFDYIGMSTLSSGDDAYLGKVTKVSIAKGGTESSPLYVYANRAAPGGVKIRFTPSIDPAAANAAAAEAFFTGEPTTSLLTILPNAPVLSAAVTDYPNKAPGATVNLKFPVADAIGQLKGPYTLYVDAKGQNPDTPDDWPANTVTVNAEGMITYAYKIGAYDGGLTLKPKFYIKNQDGNASSPPLSVTIHVNPAKEIAVTADKPALTYCEGDTAVLSFALSERFDGTGFLFLEPADWATTNLVDCAAFWDGIEIRGDEVEPATLFFKDDDSGRTLGKRDFSFNVVIREAATNQAATISGWGSKPRSIRLSVTNAIPSVQSVKVNSRPAVTVSGSAQSGLSANVENTFTIRAKDAKNTEIDLNATNFVTEVSFWEGDAAAASYTTNLLGNPVEQKINYAFTTGGANITNRIEVVVIDKDMTFDEVEDARAAPFVVYYPTGDAPAIGLSRADSGGNTFNETETGTKACRINVDLTMPPGPTAPSGGLQVVLDVTRIDADDGNYALPVLSTTNLTFKAAETHKEVYFTSLDGTPKGETAGFYIKARVTNDTTSPDATKTWAEYYEPFEWEIFVENEDPEFPDYTGVPVTNRNAAVNRPYEIRYRVRDVANDLKEMRESLTVDGIPVGGVVTNDLSKGEGTKTVTFTTSGRHHVILSVQDKDGSKEVSREYVFLVAASKDVVIRPCAPVPNGVSNLSKKYAEATGHGVGRVWADNAPAPASIENFIQTWSYTPAQDNIKVYARGYRDGDVDNGGLTPGKDFAISEAGGAVAAGGTTAYYTYRDILMKDSFLYCWILNAGDSASGYTGTHLGLLPQVGTTIPDQPVKLPEQEDDADAAYEQTLLEAIFSREWRPEDNVGDINQDGIPDIYAAAVSWKGGPLYAAAGGSRDDENNPGDLVNLASWNGDEDVLPAPSSTGKMLIPNVVNWTTAGGPFTAFLELRGFDEGLNYRMDHDGLNRNVRGAWVSEPAFSQAEWLSVAAHNPAAGVDPQEMVTKLGDAAAWAADVATLTAYLKANDTSWIPENRTDPTTADTDEDGFPDGYEYYYWYSAAVGTITADGKWERLEGSRFSLKDIATGERISPEEIAAAFNPTVKAADNAAGTRDTDNDGLTDLEELAMCTDPVHWDTDGDGLSDFFEVMNGMHPISIAEGENGEMNADGDFMARWDSDKDYTIISIPDVGLFALKGDGGRYINPTNATELSEYGKTNFVAIKVFRYNRATDKEGVYVSSFRGGRAKNTVDRFGTMAEAKPLDARVWLLGEATNAAIDVVEKQAVTLLHDQVYAQFGFDPRTAWNKSKKGYVAPRWEPGLEGTRPVWMGDAGLAVNTVPYTALDEYLVLKYRYETNKARPEEGVLALLLNGADGDTPWTVEYDEARWASPEYSRVFTEGTTAPNVPFSSPEWVGAANLDGMTFASEVHGADTDNDGVPDGWELYVGHNPNVADEVADDEDGDGLPFALEFAGTDSCNVYSNCAKIVANHPGVTSGWYNKFFPTDPKDADTDGDGISDKAEGSGWRAPFVYGNGVNKPVKDNLLYEFTFIYGTPEDDGSTCIRGGGLNPCSVDTDDDGLPDPWERQFAGVVFSPEGKLESGVPMTEAMIKLVRRGDGLAEGAVANRHYISAGMDGTFGCKWGSTFTGDAYTNPNFVDPATDTCRDFDFDHDGLQNYQEYLVQALRHLRYDDSSTPLMGQWMPSGAPSSLQFFGFLPMNVMDGETYYASVKEAGFPATGAWDFRKLGYFAAPPKAWDKAALNTATMGRVNYDEKGYRVMLRPQAVSGGAQAGGYCTTDPRKWDTDGDGMDDYYELFHGLNPLLGAYTGRSLADSIENDVIAQAYLHNGVVRVASWMNAWTGWPSKPPTDLVYDAMRFPWFLGTPGCDADGDGKSNFEEALYANMTSPQSSHTDPTPLWMTDASSAKSFTAQYYKMDCDALTPDFAFYPWAVADRDGFMFSFEENEGYDTDHDGISDIEESRMTATETSDPLDFTDPDRRQALWLPGDKSAAVSYACAPGNESKIGFDAFRQFTAEAWIKPEDVARDQVILERAAFYPANALSNSVGKVRANFRIGLRADGRLYGMYDGSDTVETALESRSVFVEGPKPVTNVWTHVALTFNGSQLCLYCDGRLVANAAATLVPANGVVAFSQEPLPKDVTNIEDVFPGSEVFTKLPSAVVLGARAVDAAGVSLGAKTTWANYDAFYKGYLDEVRMWDGAKSAAELLEDYKTRFTAADAKRLREAVYTAWTEGATRDDNDGKKTLPVELVYHYNFQTLPGAVDAADVMWEPSGFSKNVLDSVRVGALPPPGGLCCGWWEALPVRSTVYANYHWVPWVQNLVAHLPALDGSTVDSKYWASRVAGVCSPVEALVGEAFLFPNTMNPYAFYHNNGGNDDAFYNNRLKMLADLDSAFAPAYYRFRFQRLRTSLGTTDLVPLGGAFAKRCAEMWDGMGAADAWTYAGVDINANGIPDWWEGVAKAKYGAPVGFTWETLVNYNGQQMTAREAYIRDLAAGMQPDGKTDDAYKSLVDRDGDGLPDWWEGLYGILAEDGRADSDHDGLSNMAEYLCSEVFAKLDPAFPKVSPRKPYSFEAAAVPDYFLRVGSLYLGEMFSDHDFCEDDWEDLYATPVPGQAHRLYASRFACDLWTDSDGDGWSNYAECRAGTDPTREKSLSYVSDDVVEYPIPTVEVAAHYNGSQKPNGTLVVRAYHSAAEAGTPDATWKVSVGKAVQAADGSSSSTGSSGSSSGSDGEDSVGFSYSRQLGMNPGVATTYSLGSGAIVPGSVQVSFRDLNTYAVASNGTFVILNPAATSWCMGLREVITGDERKVGKLVAASLDDIVGTVDYEKGAVTIDFSKLGEFLYRVSETEGDSTGNGIYTWYSPGFGKAYERLAVARSFVKIQWRGQVVASDKRWAFNLAKADEGHLRAGANTFEAFIDLDGNGAWTAGEPYGVATGVDVNWSRAAFALEMTDTAPQTYRIDLRAAASANDFESQKAVNDRAAKDSLALDANKEVSGNRVGDKMPLPNETATRTRILLSEVNDIAWVSDVTVTWVGGVALDVTKNLRENPVFSERDVRQAGILDVAWGDLLASQASAVGFAFANVTSATYSVVLGDGPVDTTVPSNINRLATAFVNKYEKGAQGAQTKCVPLNAGKTVYAAQPTFSWTHENPINKDYPAFRLRVWKSDGTTLVYDSHEQAAPPRDARGVYSWTPPLYADMVTPEGVVFETPNNYKWSVSMLDAKFTTPNTSETKSDFRLECSGAGGAVSDYGSIRASVKYFGPAATSFAAAVRKGLVRVQAFASPDFSGMPAAEAFLSDGALLTDKTSNAVNCTLKGLQPGTYYVRAYIDSDASGVCAEWKSWGYANFVGTGVKTPYTPKGVDIVRGSVERPFVTVYIEDMDTDNDGFPDAYEYDQKGNLEEIGPASGTTYFTRVNPYLKAALDEYAGLLGAQFTSTPLMTMLSLASGEATEATLAAANLFAAPGTAPAKDEIFVSIDAFSLADGITLGISSEATAGGSSFIALAESGAETTFTVQLVAADALDFANAEVVTVKTITLRANAPKTVVIDAETLAAAIKASGLDGKAFFKVRLVK